jgi:O-succinylbenzoic acid--CoA ligase
MNSEIPFTALPGITLAVDPSNCLIIDAPGIAHGTVVTNDLVELVSERQFYWVGRNDTVINSGGVKIIPELLEEKIRQYIGSPFFAAGIPHTSLGEQLVLIVEGNEQKDTLKTILGELTTLRKYEQPRAIYFVDSFLRTPTNKIRRKDTLATVLDQSS